MRPRADVSRNQPCWIDLHRGATLVLSTVLILGVAGCAEVEEAPEPQPSSEAGPAMARLSVADPPSLNVLEGTECPPYEQEELREPVKIHPVDGVLETHLVVAMKTRCVPLFDTAANRWNLKPLTLRTYGHPRDPSVPVTAEMAQRAPEDPAGANVVWTAPGPTFVLHKATGADVNDGDRFKMTLYNVLPPQEDPHGCDTLHRLPNAKGEGEQGPFTPTTEPNCFHGDNTTNFHFHGFHVSPQPHQDFVGLELLPFDAIAPEHSVHARGDVAIGEYDYDVDPLRYTQAEGTHWYHAHKHGSTALQVLNGLVGTFEIRGAFDEELEALFADQGGLPDRLLVVQQLQENPTGLAGDPPGPPSPLINGMANPIVKMRPGEIQRWRFVSATMMASAQLEIGFPVGPPGTQPEVRQIAMDGVQFAPENYTCQPILHGPDCQAGTEDDSFKDLNSLLLDPGTRADFLIKAPQEPGSYVMTFEMVAELAEDAAAEVEERNADLIELIPAAVRAAIEEEGEPPLLTLVVEGDTPLDTSFPTQAQFPKLPAYLTDIPQPSTTRTVAYQMNDKRGTLDQVAFSICDEPYDPSCVNETLTLDVAEQWTLTNNSSIAHPFHIHTNPFQLVEDAAGTYSPPYVWRDTLAIPKGSPDDLGQALIRYVAREFTGEFVNHCHILGHEDRGMMHNVQAVCPNGKWGRPTSDLSPECREGNYQDAAPECEKGLCAPTS